MDDLLQYLFAFREYLWTQICFLPLVTSLLAALYSSVPLAQPGSPSSPVCSGIGREKIAKQQCFSGLQTGSALMVCLMIQAYLFILESPKNH